MKKFDTTEIFIDKAILVHGERYDYSNVNYLNSKTNVSILCKLHGIFEQNPNKHLQKKGCPKCGFISRCKKASSNTDEFIEKATEKHGSKYDYSEVNYKGKEEKVDIKCSKHGIFKQTPHNHLAGNGCPICRESQGEIKINLFLTDKNIDFTPQKRFDDCRHLLPLPFDFYLPKENICIEYQGIQHFKPRAKFGGQEEFEKTQIRDAIKVKYCHDNNIKLIVIPYYENILKILNSFW